MSHKFKSIPYINQINMLESTILGPLFAKAYRLNSRRFGPFEKVQQTDAAELYILRYPWPRGSDRPSDPEFRLITRDGVLSTFGLTGLVSAVDDIGEDGTLTEILRRDVQGNLELNRGNLPVNGVVDDPALTEEQLTSLVINYVYNQARELPDDGDNTLSRLFYYWDAQSFVSRFRDFRALKSGTDIIPDESDLTVHVKISDGCPFSCTYCPEGGGFFPQSMDEIMQTMRTTRALQEEYHQRAISNMTEGFINTSDLLLFTNTKYAQLGVDPRRVVLAFKDTFPEVKKLGTFFGVKSVLKSAEDPSYGEKFFDELREAGLNRAYIGIETGHDEGSKLLGKPETFYDKLRAMNLLKQHGIAVKAIIQVGVLGKGFYPRGTPEEERTPGNLISSEEAIQRTVSLINQAQPYRVMMSEFVPYDGLPIFGDISDGLIIPYKDPAEGIRREIAMLNSGIVLERGRAEEDNYQRFLPQNQS